MTTDTNPTLLHMRKSRDNMYRGQQNWEEEENTNTNPAGGPEGTPNPDTDGRVDANLPPEEQTYAKRYADLRRQEAKNATETKRKMEELTNQIADLKSGAGNRLPTSEADIQEWMAKYPDLASAILHVADTRTKENTKRLQSQIAKLEEDSLEIQRERAYLNLKKLHPDVDAIRESAEFHKWVEQQPGDIQGWFYENETDHITAARGIQLFKLETSWKSGKKKEVKDDTRANSRTVVEPKAPEINPEGGNKRQWRESEIRKLKGKEYEAVEEELDLAAREGRIIYDIKNSRF